MFLSFVLAFGPFSVPGTVQAQVSPRPFEPLARAIRVRGYPIPDGRSAEAFRTQRQEAQQRAEDDAISVHGRPLIRETLSHGGVYLAYPGMLVIITGEYSNRIICRVDVEPGLLRSPVSVDDVIPVAAGACRDAEVHGWPTADYAALRPIGAEPVPGISGGTGEIYATDQLFTLFDHLVRDVEVGQRTRARLLRSSGRSEPFQNLGAAQWRYAWFADGTFLAVRYQVPARVSYGRHAIGLACVFKGQAQSLTQLDSGPFVDWCSGQTERLRPGLPAFIAAVQDYRGKPENQPRETGPIVPSLYGGFHSPNIPSALADQFWRTGIVAPSPDS